VTEKKKKGDKLKKKNNPTKPLNLNGRSISIMNGLFIFHILNEEKWT